MSYQSVNPATGKVLKKFNEITKKQLETPLKTAATCFDTWRFKTFAERAVVVVKAAAILRARVDDFAKLVTLEMGKLIGGIRNSGYGRELSSLGIQEFVNKKLVRASSIDASV